MERSGVNFIKPSQTWKSPFLTTTKFGTRHCNDLHAQNQLLVSFPSICLARRFLYNNPTNKSVNQPETHHTLLNIHKIPHSLKFRNVSHFFGPGSGTYFYGRCAVSRRWIIRACSPRVCPVLRSRGSFQVIQPSQGSTCRGGESCTITWLDDGSRPLLSAIGVSTVGLYTGKQVRRIDSTLHACIHVGRRNWCKEYHLWMLLLDIQSPSRYVSGIPCRDCPFLPVMQPDPAAGPNSDR